MTDEPGLPAAHLLPVIETPSGTSGSSTAKKALAMLIQADASFRVPSRAQRRILAMALAAEDKIVYGKAFDAVKLPAGVEVDLDDLDSVKSNLSEVMLYEVKSTNRENVGEDFKGYFFALTTAELLVAQSLGAQFKFLLIHTLTGHYLELSLPDLLKRTRAIYPSWSVLF